MCSRQTFGSNTNDDNDGGDDGDDDNDGFSFLLCSSKWNRVSPFILAVEKFQLLLSFLVKRYSSLKDILK